MAIYDVKSLKAEEFINDGEILETIKYAEENKNNIELIPAFNGFEGTVSKNLNKEDNCSWLVCGRIKKLSQTKIEINEVPPSYSLEEYLAELDKLEESKKIKEYQDKAYYRAVELQRAAKNALLFDEFYNNAIDLCGEFIEIAKK